MRTSPSAAVVTTRTDNNRVLTWKKLINPLNTVTTHNVQLLYSQTNVCLNVKDFTELILLSTFSFFPHLVSSYTCKFAWVWCEELHHLYYRYLPKIMCQYFRCNINLEATWPINGKNGFLFEYPENVFLWWLCHNFLKWVRLFWLLNPTISPDCGTAISFFSLF